MALKEIFILWIVLFMIKPSLPIQHRSRYISRAKENNGSTSEPFSQELKLIPGGTQKRTVYTGRYCAYPNTRRVPHRVKNGSQTYLRRVVSQCPWSSLYCNPQVRFVIASRHSYRIQMKVITTDEWRCCPGFSGSNCEEVCFNCTKMTELNERIERLSRQISFGSRDESGQVFPGLGSNVNDLRGPEGPPGSMGLPGQRGPAGSPGQKGEKGVIGQRGFPGVTGAKGEAGNTGANGKPGLKGISGTKGEQGLQGPAGPVGLAGPRGEKGMPGTIGRKGDVGPIGLRGESGLPGPQGPIGPFGPEGRPGQKGATGLEGPPGLPGICQCSNRPTMSTDLPRVEDLEAGPTKYQLVKPEMISTPATVEFCGSSLWKRSLEELTCDFDVAIESASVNHIVRKDRHNDATFETRRKGGTFCLFSQKVKRKKWVLATGLNVPKDKHQTSKSSSNFENGQIYDEEQSMSSKPSAQLPVSPSYVYRNDHYLILRTSTSLPQRRRTPRLFSPFFSNTRQGLCMTFRYIVHSRPNSNFGLLVFLLPCNPPYRVPILNLTAPPRGNKTDIWRKIVVPLPDYKRPYQIVFEARSGNQDSEFIAMDDVIFSSCGSNTCVHEGVTRRNQELWKTSRCRECVCLEGNVQCFDILCAARSCQHAYKPSDYCCPVCCPNQVDKFPVYGSGDGAAETLSYNDDYVPNNSSFYSEYDTYEEPEMTNNELPSDASGCPVPSNASTSESLKSSNEDAVCMLSKDTGPCRARSVKFYFDSKTMTCRTFTYGGCEGNANNFDSERECNRMCLAKDTSPPQSLSDDARPLRPRRCNYPKDVGECKALMPRFYYDVKQERCRLFIFGGCNGNDNRFFTPWACRDVCGGSRPVLTNEEDQTKPDGDKPKQCLLPKVQGPCRASHTRFYYNSITNKCQVFIYGGCGGNQNNFELPTECMAVCGGEPNFDFERIEVDRGPQIQPRSIERSTSDTRCLQPLDEGPCKGTFYRYFFNSQTNKCSVFLYRGCRGNDNNFDSAEECQNACGGGGYNFTLTLQSDIYDEEDAATSALRNTVKKHGPRGPKGERGPPGVGVQGPVGPSGPPGPPGRDGLSSLSTDDVRSIKTTIASLKSRILFLETKFLTSLSPSRDVETINVPNIVSSDGDEEITDETVSHGQIKPHEILKAVSDNEDDESDVSPYYYISESESE